MKNIKILYVLAIMAVSLSSCNVTTEKKDTKETSVTTVNNIESTAADSGGDIKESNPNNSNSDISNSSMTSNGSGSSNTLSNEESTKPKVIENPDGTKKFLLPEEIEVYDKDGKPVKLTDFQGKKMIINMWASWCPPCRAEMPDLMELEKEMKDDEVLVMINLTYQRETMELANEFLKKQNLSFKNMTYDTKMLASMAIGSQSIPTSYFVDKDGYIVFMAEGMMTKEKFRQTLDKVK